MESMTAYLIGVSRKLNGRANENDFSFKSVVKFHGSEAVLHFYGDFLSAHLTEKVNDGELEIRDCIVDPRGDYGIHFQLTAGDC